LPAWGSTSCCSGSSSECTWTRCYYRAALKRRGRSALVTQNGPGGLVGDSLARFIGGGYLAGETRKASRGPPTKSCGACPRSGGGGSTELQDKQGEQFYGGRTTIARPEHWARFSGVKRRPPRSPRLTTHRARRDVGGSDLRGDLGSPGRSEPARSRTSKPHATIKVALVGSHDMSFVHFSTADCDYLPHRGAVAVIKSNTAAESSNNG
jgi:hypothetical protein